MGNLMCEQNQGIQNSQWTTGLSSYQYSYCSVNLTAGECKIELRPFNPTIDSVTSTGGLKIVNSTNLNNAHIYDSFYDNIFGLTKGHTYRITFNVRGKSSFVFTHFGWYYEATFTGGGLAPSPSSVSSQGIAANFNDYNNAQECFYEFTINDDVVKTCTSTVSGYHTNQDIYTQGNQYLSYNHFCIGFNVTATRSNGYQIYISNLRMYDITNGEEIQIFKIGSVSPLDFVEQDANSALMNRYGEILGNQFYEY